MRVTREKGVLCVCWVTAGLGEARSCPSTLDKTLPQRAPKRANSGGMRNFRAFNVAIYSFLNIHVGKYILKVCNVHW